MEFYGNAMAMTWHTIAYNAIAYHAELKLCRPLLSMDLRDGTSRPGVACRTHLLVKIPCALNSGDN